MPAEDLQQLMRQLKHAVEQYTRYRDRCIIDLNAAHSLMSPVATAMMGSKLDDKGASGRPGRRHHTGVAHVDRIEALAEKLARHLFGARYIELRPLSGALSNMIATLAFVDGNDVLMAVPEWASGHRTYGRRGYPGRAGATVVDVPYDETAMQVDADRLRRAAQKVRPRMIVIGTSLCLFPSPVQEIRDIAEEVGAILLYDAAHVLGLIVGGEFQDPLREGAHLVSASTQKTLPGPIGGIILTNDPALATCVQETTDNLVSNYINSRIAALAVTFAEMLAFGTGYATAIVENARALAEALDRLGLRLLGKGRGFTDSHQVVIDGRVLGNAIDTTARLEECGIICSHVLLAADYKRPGRLPTGIRLGVADVTRRGMASGQMRTIAELIARSLLTEEPAMQIADEAQDLVAGFQRTLFCFETLEEE